MKTMQFCEKLRHERETRGLSVRELAEISGIHRVSIYKYEHGDAFPGMLALCDLADALRISLDELVGRKFP